MTQLESVDTDSDIVFLSDASQYKSAADNDMWGNDNDMDRLYATVAVDSTGHVIPRPRRATRQQQWRSHRPAPTPQPDITIPDVPAVAQVSAIPQQGHARPTSLVQANASTAVTAQPATRPASPVASDTEDPPPTYAEEAPIGHVGNLDPDTQAARPRCPIAPHDEYRSIPGSFMVCVYGTRSGIFPNTYYYRAYLGGVQESIYEVYSTRPCAQFVLESAVVRGLVGGPFQTPPASLANVLRPLDPHKSMVRNSALAAEGNRLRYYVVYYGHCPGVYDNWIEAGLCLLGMGRDVTHAEPYKVYTTWSSARQAFLEHSMASAS
ncbi:hypothetical protein CYLTODRAFT_447349 [Cylindrobasidium torrendii FP15055 ss-10]|uniref:Uncharacterized protein n=1 Tax=Cylindrobasidium torrendii FP15055 ss-10 TaxID=1314674 RepID=A0A0D7AY58_9AGAR|nr:hypothetical protein CYLTODRAFT_447349 [Cylindrobasidium torrendii FP15055 ss-10]